MTRAEFMGRLKQGLVGLPMATAAEIAADYETHFEDGAAAGVMREIGKRHDAPPHRLMTHPLNQKTSRQT